MKKWNKRRKQEKKENKESEKIVFTKIVCQDSEKKISCTLKVTEEEFEQIVKKYSTGKRYEKKYIPYSERVEEAKRAAGEDETLSKLNFIGIDSEVFIKGAAVLYSMLKILFRVMLNHDKFRIVIDYNAENLKTDFYIYTPNEDESEKQEGRRFD